MDYEIKIYPKDRLVVERISGDVNLEGLQAKATELFENPSYDKAFPGIIDLREAHAQLSKAELNQFGLYLQNSQQFGEAPWALIGSDTMILALGNIFQQFISSEQKFGVFGNIDDAANFIGKADLEKFISI